MKTKRITAILLSLVMVFALGACGNKKEAGKTSGKLTSADVDKTTFKGLKFDTNPDLDFGGKTITIARDTAPKEGISANYDRELAIKAAIEKKYNVKIEYLEYGAHNKAVENLVLHHMAGTSWADIVFNTSPALLDVLTNEGIYRPLDDYIDYSIDRFKLTSKATKYVDGKHYSYYPIVNEQGYMIYYNTEILAANNCEDPKDLYESGKWDWNALQKIAKACTGEKNGKKIYGFAGSNILDGLMASNGMAMISLNSKNQAVCNLFTDKGKKVLDFTRTLAYVDKVVDGTYGSHNGIETFKNSFASMIVGPIYYGSHFVQSGIPYDMVPLPKGPDTDSYTNLRQYCYCYAFPTNSTYKTEELLQIAFELERNDPAIEGAYREDNYDGKLQVYVDEHVDQGNNYIDDTQAKYVFDFINDNKTNNLVDWATDDIKATITSKIYLPISKGEDVRSHLTSIESVIKTALTDKF